jgi:putative addiction module killer protein
MVFGCVKYELLTYLALQVSSWSVILQPYRVQQGNYGDVELIGEGLSELRLFFGSGYRVYFGEDAGNIVVILFGGDKSSQDSDIENAKAYWQEY